MAEVPSWKALFERSAREDVSEDVIRKTLATIRTEKGDRDG